MKKMDRAVSDPPRIRLRRKSSTESNKKVHCTHDDKFPTSSRKHGRSAPASKQADDDREFARRYRHAKTGNAAAAVGQDPIPKSRHESPRGLTEVRIPIIKLFGRIERFGEKVDEAFAGQPFLPHVAPDAPANRRRFNAYFYQCKQVSKLLFRALHLWRLANGVILED